MKDHEFENSPDLGSAMYDAARNPARPSVEIDVEKYQAILDAPSMSEAQKREVMEALWSIIVGFVDLGFGVHPLQQACGQLKNDCDARDRPESDAVNSGDTDLRTEFNDAPARD